MNKELVAMVELLEKEKGIPQDIMFETIEKALLDEYRQEFSKSDNARIVLDRKTGDIHIYSNRLVVEEVSAVDQGDGRVKKVSGFEISLEDARKIKADAQLGEEIEVEVTDFSRKAAKTGKNTIVQAIRTAEKEAVYRRFKAVEGQLISAIVQRVDDKGNVIVDLGNATQARLSSNGDFKDRTFYPGDRIKVYVKSVRNYDSIDENANKDKTEKQEKKKRKGIAITITRNDAEFVKKLFEEEVAEIQDGSVEIMEVAREAGSRTKVAVRSNVANVDPVGACVGVKGARVNRIKAEISGRDVVEKDDKSRLEQIDIIEWDANSAQYIANSLSPATIISAYVDDNAKQARIIVSEQQLSLAIGGGGQNVRLAAGLTKFKIDIKSENDPDAMLGIEDGDNYDDSEYSDDEYFDDSEDMFDEE